MIELIAIAIGGLGLLVAIHYVSRKTSGLNRDYYRKKWHEIRTLEHASAAAARLAVIEADKLLDHALKHLSFQGATMADRLKAADRALPNPGAVWAAHKLRNSIAHEDIHPKPADIHRSLNTFESTLKKLGAL